MRIVGTGNMGYSGPALARVLRREIRDCKLVGFDAGFFGHCLSDRGVLPEVLFDLQQRDASARIYAGLGTAWRH